MPAVRRRHYDDLFDYHNSRGYFHPYNVAARRAYTQRWFALAGRAAGVVGAVGTAAVSNLLTNVPSLDTRPDMGRSLPVPKRDVDDALLPERDDGSKKARSFVDRSAADQISFGSDVYGRKLSKVQRLMKLIASSTTIRRDYFGALSDQTAVCGRYGLTFFNSGGSMRLPLYMVDLTGIVQGTSGALGAKHHPAVMSRLKMVGATEAYAFSPVSGLYPYASTQQIPTWSCIEGKHPGIPSNQMFDKALISTIDIGMIIHGARNYASTVWVQLVQFDDESFVPPVRIGNSAWMSSGAGDTWEHYDPDFVGTGVPTDYDEIYPWDTDSPDAATIKKFWTQQVEHLTGNPLSRETIGAYVPGMKVLYSKKFKFQPVGNEVTTVGASTYGDADGRQVVFKLKYHMDKVVDYNIADAAEGAMPETDLVDVNKFAPLTTHTDLYPVIRPKGRVYLMIRGTAPAVSNAVPTTTADVANTYASFDLRVERVIQKLRAETNLP